jgi:hypothetical protein
VRPRRRYGRKSAPTLQSAFGSLPRKNSYLRNELRAKLLARKNWIFTSVVETPMVCEVNYQKLRQFKQCIFLIEVIYIRLCSQWMSLLR